MDGGGPGCLRATIVTEGASFEMVGRDLYSTLSIIRPGGSFIDGRFLAGAEGPGCCCC